MRKWCAVLLCAALAACGSGNGAQDDETAGAADAVDTAQPLAPTTVGEPWPETVELPRLGTVGDLPPAGRRVVLAIGKDGATWIDGAPGDLRALDKALKALADGGDPMRIDLVVAGDTNVPWGALQHVLQRAAGSLVRRIWFVARHESDGGSGGIALFLPRDVGLMPQQHAGVTKLTVKVGEGWPPSNPLALHVPFEPHARRFGFIEIDAAATTPLGLVLRIADVAAQQGCAGVTFVGAAGRSPDELRTLVSSLGEKRARKLTIRGVEPTDLPILIPAAVRVKGPAGFTEPLDDMPEEEPIEEVEPEDD